ncbi:MAG: hypothetical protein QF486_03360 [Candidatus Woesearchaeota archaeon]|jgi:hypothetical protein|nr:hypothetical protein [Candidatus Woesearchaeota archaeon]MDP7198634.1 hypothetical protein [Candidatus Woesearchaeota archaeon]MDP7466624.1 hypothetical protein [Candidatus Woesearchaeota archaeon]MDP7646880.1 hypothetical protein [Candidatus Woesearchaeota archaeon]
MKDISQPVEHLESLAQQFELPGGKEALTSAVQYMQDLMGVQGNFTRYSISVEHDDNGLSAMSMQIFFMTDSPDGEGQTEDSVHQNVYKRE